MPNVCSSSDCFNEPRPNQWYCHECHAEYMQKQRKDGKNKIKSSPERALKVHARIKAYRAEKKGILVNPGCCENCKQDKTLQKHHPDYSKPLEIVWLCVRCHAELHANEAKMAETG